MPNGKKVWSNFSDVFSVRFLVVPPFLFGPLPPSSFLLLLHFLLSWRRRRRRKGERRELEEGILAAPLWSSHVCLYGFLAQEEKGERERERGKGSGTGERLRPQQQQQQKKREKENRARKSCQKSVSLPPASVPVLARPVAGLLCPVPVPPGAGVPSAASHSRLRRRLSLLGRPSDRRRRRRRSLFPRRASECGGVSSAPGSGPPPPPPPPPPPSPLLPGCPLRSPAEWRLDVGASLSLSAPRPPRAEREEPRKRASWGGFLPAGASPS